MQYNDEDNEVKNYCPTREARTRLQMQEYVYVAL